MFAFILIVSLTTPAGLPSESVDRFDSKAACVAAADAVKVAMVAAPNGYKLRRVECLPAAK